MLTVRALGLAARSLGLSAPSFQSPPRADGLDRSIQRMPSGDCVVAVRVKGRPFGAVVADAIEGIVVCNELGTDAAGAVRDELWREAGSIGNGPELRGHAVSSFPLGEAA